MRTPGPEPLARAALALAALAASGCASMSTRQAAEPLPQGRWEVSGALDVVAVRDVPQDTRAVAPQVEIMGRRGFGSGVDAWGKLFLFGIEAGAKWRFHRGERWSLAVAPSIASSRGRETTSTTAAWHLFGQLTGLVGYRFSERSSLNFGPKLLYGLYLPRDGGHAQGLMPGVFVNVVLPVGERWKIIPDLNLYRTAAGEVPVDGGALQAGVGVGREF